ncbi:TPA: NYN domain-containing protein [Candidatus Bipolaricaulota bacterium]|nr:NYN domain-containing protein [Candidatus Bipolaricaulota bacterium]HIP99939.1 NYN domain-containing protein [Candidatus Bipolaricaulota bacterium]
MREVGSRCRDRRPRRMKWRVFLPGSSRILVNPNNSLSGGSEMQVKAAVLVDVQNLQETFERQGMEVRYDALKEHLKAQLGYEDREVKFLAFVPYKREDDRRMRLIDALSFMGFRVITKPVREHPDGGMKANMDVELVLEAVNLAQVVGEMVIVTGDSDFVPLVDFLSRHGVRITVLGPGRGSTSVELIRASDSYSNLDSLAGVVIPRYHEESAPSPE